MEILIISVLAILSYLLGSIPSSVWLGMRFANVDVREHGSGNAGATNTFRVLGKKHGTIVLIIEIIKAYGRDSCTQINNFFPRKIFSFSSIYRLYYIFEISALSCCFINSMHRPAY